MFAGSSMVHYGSTVLDTKSETAVYIDGFFSMNGFSSHTHFVYAKFTFSFADGTNFLFYYVRLFVNFFGHGFDYLRTACYGFVKVACHDGFHSTSVVVVKSVRGFVSFDGHSGFFGFSDDSTNS